MKNEIALRYLLLRHIKSLENKVQKSIFIEVTKSLQVTANTEFYVINWQIAEKQKNKKYFLKEFQFYRRGDLNPEKRSVNDALSTNNDNVAHAFAIEALDIDTTNQFKKAEKIKVDILYSVIENIIFVLVLVLLGRIGYFSGFVLLAILLVEYLYNGRLYASILFIFLAFVSQGAALAGSIAYAILQFLDPNSIGRQLRIILNVSVFLTVILLQIIGWFPPFYFNTLFLIALFFAFFIAGYGSFFSIHYRVMPLALPFICAGFILDKMIMAAVFGLILSLVYTIRIAYYKGENNVY